MDIGIGLPATIPGVEREQVLDWARRADRSGFSSLGTIDRVVYPNWEPLAALAAAAAVTERIRLATTILILTLRTNTAELAKQAATIDCLSGGRLTLGVAVGARDDDFEASAVPMAGRGARFEQQLADLKEIWSGGAIGPRPVQDGGPPLIIGGQVDATFDRVAKFGDGYIMGGGAPDQFAQAAARAQEAWSRAGRAGEPRLMSLAYFALGPDAAAAANSYLHDYYAWLGPIADQIAASAATDGATVRQYVDAFAAAGCDELIMFPCSPEPEQVDLLADAAL